MFTKWAIDSLTNQPVCGSQGGLLWCLVPGSLVCTFFVVHASSQGISACRYEAMTGVLGSASAASRHCIVRNDGTKLIFQEAGPMHVCMYNSDIATVCIKRFSCARITDSDIVWTMACPRHWLFNSLHCFVGLKLHPRLCRRLIWETQSAPITVCKRG